MVMHGCGRIFLLACAAIVLCLNLRAELNGCEKNYVLAAEVGMNVETKDFNAQSRALLGSRFGLYDVNAEEFGRYRLYGLEVDAVSVGGKREVYGLQGGLASWCSLGGGLFVGICNFVSNYKGVEFGILNAFNTENRQFLSQSVMGVQVGAINLNSSELALQCGLVNAQEVKRNGFVMEIGLGNLVEMGGKSGTAVQCGFWNSAETKCRDDFVFQIGLANWLAHGYEQELCVQVGLLNMKKKTFDEGWSIVPLISVSM